MAYRVTVPPFSAVRFLTEALSGYSQLPFLVVDQPAKLQPVLVYAFAVRLLVAS